MQDLLANSEPFVERNRRLVAIISLNEDDPGSALNRYRAQAADERCRYTLPAMLFTDRQVVDVHLAPLPLELLELVGYETAHDLFACERHKDNHVLFREKTLQIGVARRLPLVCLGISKRLPEQGVQRPKSRAFVHP